MSHQTSDPELQACIAACLDCHKVCLHMALTHCLEEGGKHTEPQHYRLMLNCAEICQTAANFMIGGSELHHLTCGVCAEVCQRCANSCSAIPGMEHCAEACRKCAESCRAMAS
jgi:hypothetical protein